MPRFHMAENIPLEIGLTERIQIRYKDLEEFFATQENPAVLDGINLTINTASYYFQMVETFHWNNCKSGCKGFCFTCAADLTKTRLRNISNGMPDLHPREANKVWNYAFAFHNSFCGGGPINPFWSSSRPASSNCICFERGYEQYKQDVRMEEIRTMKINPEDTWYEQRYE